AHAISTFGRNSCGRLASILLTYSARKNLHIRLIVTEFARIRPLNSCKFGANEKWRHTLVRTRLSIMMFLEFFIWGAWLPLIFGYLPSLGFNALEQALILNAFALASFVAMFFSNQFADRNFAAERFLAFSQLVGGLAIFGLFFIKGGWSFSLLGWDVNVSFWLFFTLMLIHSLFYVPTISITNSIAFANLRDP